MSEVLKLLYLAQVAIRCIMGCVRRVEYTIACSLVGPASLAVGMLIIVLMALSSTSNADDDVCMRTRFSHSLTYPSFTGQ